MGQFAHSYKLDDFTRERKTQVSGIELHQLLARCQSKPRLSDFSGNIDCIRHLWRILQTLVLMGIEPQPFSRQGFMLPIWPKCQGSGYAKKIEYLNVLKW